MVKEFGALSFAATMNVRQVASIIPYVRTYVRYDGGNLSHVHGGCKGQRTKLLDHGVDEELPTLDDFKSAKRTFSKLHNGIGFLDWT